MSEATGIHAQKIGLVNDVTRLCSLAEEVKRSRHAKINKTLDKYSNGSMQQLDVG